MVMVGLVSGVAMGAQIPLTEELENRLFALESKQLPQSTKGVVRAVFDPSHVTRHASSTVESGIHGLGVSLPAKALITNSYGYVVTQLAGANATLAFQCEDSGNLLSARDLNDRAAGAFFGGKQYGMSALNGFGSTINGFTDSIASPCEVQAVVGTSDFTAGKVILYVEYVLGE